MNVLIVVAHLRKGGPVDVVFNLCRKIMERKDIRLSIVTLRKETNASKLSDFTNLGICVDTLDCSYLDCELRTWVVVRKLSEIVRRKKIDIVHCHTYHPVLVGAKLKGVKLVATLHNRADEDFVNVYGKIVGGYMIRRYYRALRNFDKNIAVSESTAEFYERKLSNVSYVNNGVDVDKFSVISKEAQQQLRLKCHLPMQAIILVSSGRIEREKRYEELLQWFSGFTHTNPNYILLILGDGSRLNACKAMANGKVVFTGRVSNVVDYLQCADYYISNSQSEGMSMAVCEGMSCGLFPILSDIPAHRNVAEGIGGVFFPHPTNICMEEIVLHHTNPHVIHHFIEQNFSIDVMVQGYVQAYYDVMKRL